MTNNLVEQILEKANIVDIIGKFVSLHKSGANYFGLCPFHPDNHASMSVSSKKKIFKCFSCGTAGNVITFVQKFKKISYPEAIKEVARILGYSQQDIDSYFHHQDKLSPKYQKLFSLNSQANDIYKSLLLNEANKKNLQYLLDRNLSLKTIQKFELGFCGRNEEKTITYDLLVNKEINSQANWNENDLLQASLININEKTLKITDYFYNRITFPIKDKNGFIVGFIARDPKTSTELKYLSSKETVLFNKSQIFYNIENIVLEKPENIILLEGNIDLLSLYEAGLDEAKYGPLALMGTALTRQHLLILKKMPFVKNIILWFDNDEAGKRSAMSNGLFLVKNGFNVLVVNDKTEYKDVNEILLKENKNTVLSMLDDENILDFFSFFITQKLQKISSLNLINEIEGILVLLNQFANPLFWSKYCQLISSLTHLSQEDINVSYKKLATKKFYVNNQYDNGYHQFQNNENKKIIKLTPIQKNYLKAYQDLLILLFLNPFQANLAYAEIEYNISSWSLVNDVIYLIKSLATNQFDDKKDLFLQEEKLINELFAAKKIKQDSWEKFSQILFNQKNIYQNNLTKDKAKNKIIKLVHHLNKCANEILIDDYNKQLINEHLTLEQKQKIRQKINNLTIKITAFKKANIYKKKI